MNDVPDKAPADLKTEPLSDVVERLAMSVQSAAIGDRGYQETVRVSTKDLMMLVGTVKKNGQSFMRIRVGVSHVRRERY